MDLPGRMEKLRAEMVALRVDTARELQQQRSRRRAGLNWMLHDIDRMLVSGYPYVSQAGQDRIVDRLLGGRTGGSFVDIGGYDGFTGSNTYFFEAHRGWAGVLVEPVKSRREMAEARRRCPCIGVAVAAETGRAEFMEIEAGFTQMSGLLATYDGSRLEAVRADERHREKVRSVETRSLSEILTEAGLMHPDFVSLDIEGGEEAVLAAFPFERHEVKVWSIENNDGSDRISGIMRAAGYDLVDFCGPDEIYRKRANG